MGADLSDRYAAAFAATVERLGDLERRRFLRTALGLTLAAVDLAVVVLLVVLKWPWRAVLSFVVAFCLAPAAGMVLVARRLFRT